MLNPVLIKQVAITFLGALLGVGLVWLIRSYFKKSLTKSEIDE